MKIENDDLVFDRVSFEFFQDTNSVDGDPDDVEKLKVDCISQLGMEKENGFFFNIKTGDYGWSIEDEKELSQLINIIGETVNFGIKKIKNRKNE